MAIRVDMSKRSKGGAPVPDGDYLAEVVSVVEGESSQKKSPQLQVQLEVSDGPYKGGRMIDFLPLSEASAFRIADFLYACGVDEESEVDVEPESFARLDAEGNEVQEQGSIVQVRKVTTEENDPSAPGGKRKRIRLYYSRPASAETQEEAAEEPAAAPAPKPAIKKAAPAAPAKAPGKVRVKA